MLKEKGLGRTRAAGGIGESRAAYRSPKMNIFVSPVPRSQSQ